MASGHAECVLHHVRTLVAASDAERTSDRELLRRFGERRDEAAFAALVRRHGPMVLGVCRRVLHDVNDAEDAFQAAFFTLARKADARHWQESVGSWLYLVAVRVARKLRAAARRRTLCESRAAALPATDPLERVTGRELCVVLDEEISRLPEDLRAPLIACCLEGMTRDEAARRLGWSLTTLKRRLAQGRQRLSDRLTRRGIALPAALAGMLAAQGAARAAVPAALARLAVTAAAQGGPSSAPVFELAQSALASSVLMRSKFVALVLLTCLAAGAALGYRPAASGKPPEGPPAQDRSVPTADLRGPKTDLCGDPLPPEALMRLGSVRSRPGVGHPDSAYKTAVTPDGRTIVTASSSDLFLWDAASGRLRKRLQGHNGYINGLEIIDGGRKAVTSAYQDGTLRVWDLIAAKEAYRIESPDKANILQAVSPDGKTLAVGGSGSLTVLFDARTGKEIHRLKGHGDFNDYGAAFTPDGRMLVVWYSADNMIYLWDLATGRKICEYAFIDSEDPARPNPVVGGHPVYFAAASPDGRLIAFGSQKRFLEVRDLASGTVLYRRTNLPDGVCPMAFTPDSRMLAWSGWWNDPTVHLVEIATGKDRRRFAGHTGRVLSLSFSADGTMLISGSGDTTALVWDLTGKLAAGDEWGKPLSAKDIEAAWQDLAADDAGRSFDAIRRLSAAPREPVAFLRRQLQPAAVVDARRIARLIAELDADEFATREKASRELEALGERAADACRKALAGAPSAEARRRLEELFAQITHQTDQPSPERLRMLRALEILERAGTADARSVLEVLARGAPGARLTEEAKAALYRLDAGSARTPR
jgi:RNA polymerase sigma factor (sigma-70 family)